MARKYEPRVLSRRTLGVVFLSLVGCAVLFAAGDDGDKLDEKNQTISSQRQTLIEREVRSLKGHAWAGDYYSGDGLGVNIDLHLAPTSGFVFRWKGCLGLYDLNYGDVVEEDGRIKFIFRLPNEQKGFEGLAPEMFPVAWGQRHYLIPADDVIGFVNKINAGTEPRKGPSGMFLLRRGDERKAAPGFPVLPLGYASYLLAHPIVAEVSSIKETRVENSRHFAVVVLNVGNTQGVKAGMKLYVYAPSTVFESARVINVSDSYSEAEIVQDDEFERNAIRPAVGWKLSTRLARD
jgi:hypothetical protein